MPYVWKCALYVTLSAVATLLELVDNPPIFYLLDFHAIWHLTTAPIAVLFYRYEQKVHDDLYSTESIISK